MVRIERDGEDLVISFQYDPQIVSRVKELTSRWDKHTHTWRVNASRVHEVEGIFPGVPIPRPVLQPGNFSLDGLRHHQQEAVRFLAGQSHCALYDPPGAGKTRPAICWTLARSGLPALVVCLRVVKIFWKREIQAICGLESADKIQILSAGDEATPLQPDAQWIICHYALLHSRLAELKKFPFRTLIVDEGHLAKAGEKSQRGAAIMKLGEDRPNVCYLTGSPSPNGRPIELLPMLKVLRKVHAREEWRWKLKFCGAEQVVINQKGVKLYGRAPIKRWSFKGASHLDELALSLSTFSLERTKAEVFGDLPPIQHTVFDIELQPDDREKYFSMREEMEKLLRTDDPKLRGRALGLLTTMIAFSAQAKTADASDVCRERINSGLKTLVICDYLSPLGALRRELRDVSEIIEGSMKDAYRQVVIDRFQNEAQPQVLLLSRRTAGQSVTLTAADCLLWLNLPWTPGEYAQGCGRIERLGQTRSTQSIVLVCADTYDEELIQLNYRKAGFIEMAAGRVPLPPARVSSFAQMLKMLGGSSRVKPDLN